MAERAAADRHVPVMRDRCVDLLVGRLREFAEAGETPVIIDATLGMGGHAEAVLASPQAEESGTVVLGLDRDPEALSLAEERLGRFGDRFRGVHTVYDQVDEVAERHSGSGMRLIGVLFDLGVSSLQLDETGRGFAYSYDAPLDMRMNAGDGSPDRTAAELLAQASETELREIIRGYGEERFAGRIASAIVARRGREPLTTTAQLAQVVDSAVPAAVKRRGGHPAKRTFQALRIAVNQELEVLERALPRALDAVAAGGRVVVLSYHSLEDRMVKRAFAARTTSSAPAGLPVELEEHRPTFRALTRGAETPEAQEIETNPRAASAKLRAAEKIGPVRSQG